MQNRSVLNVLNIAGAPFPEMPARAIDPIGSAVNTPMGERTGAYPRSISRVIFLLKESKKSTKR